MDSTHVKRGLKYARDVLNGDIPACKWVRLACKRQIDDLKRWNKPDSPYYFDKASAERVCTFIENLPHVKGVWAGQLMRLEPWQSFVWTTVFGWLHTSDNTRRFREVYLEVPRKNAKSQLGAAIGLYMLVQDKEAGAEIYSGATSEKQAWEVFRPARLMAEKAKGFADYYGVDVNASNIHCLSTASRFEPLIGNPGDGASPHCAIVDEFHEHKTPNLYDSMITGMGARTQPLMLVITTAGTDLSSPCYDKRSQVMKVLDSVFDNEELFGAIYSIDDDDEWTDFNVWKKANPNFGVSVYEDYLKSRHKEAIQRASRQNIIRCKHLNQWMNVGQAFFNMDAWPKCGDNSLNLEDFKGKPCWIGIDLASKIDLTALMILFKIDEIYYVFGKYYLPEEAAEGEDRSHYMGWAKDGYITLSSGNMTDFDIIEEDLKEIARHFNVLQVAHDPWNAAQFVAHMMEQKIPMLEIAQTVSHMSDPMKELEGLILDGRIKHTNDPVLTWMMSNVMGRHDKKDNVFPYKERQEAKIDGAVALIMALGAAIKHKDKTSKYETEGLTII